MLVRYDVPLGVVQVSVQRGVASATSVTVYEVMCIFVVDVL